MVTCRSQQPDIITGKWKLQTTIKKFMDQNQFADNV